MVSAETDLLDTVGHQIVIRIIGDQSGPHIGVPAFNKIIVYELAQNETVRHFLSGKWLELFVEHQVQQILNRYQEEQGAEVSL